MSRSVGEIWFRLRQEGSNIWLWLVPPSWPHGQQPGGLPLPPAAEIKAIVSGTRYEEQLHACARRIVDGELPVFGEWLRPSGPIAWRKDYRHGQETDLRYFRRVPYLDFQKAGDHKWVWEINRHQHLALLAQAWALDATPAYATELTAQLESWLDANPPQQGINWTSALEVAFRALSWIWILHWAGDALPEALRQRLLGSLRAHGRHLHANISIYFSPNTHLLGEALVLHALGKYLSVLPEAAGWRTLGGHWMRECLARQVREDGSYFEQSSYYHMYGLDLFLLHAVWNDELVTKELTHNGLASARQSGRAPDVLAPRVSDLLPIEETHSGPASVQRNERLSGPLPPRPRRLGAIERMAEFAAALLGDDGRIPLLGDDDGGRVFHPFGAREEFGRGSLAVFAGLAGWVPGPSAWLDREAACEVAVWWLGAKAERCWEVPRRNMGESRLFTGAGLAVLRAKGVDVTVDAGPFGPGSAGHSHADTLSMTVRRHGREVLIDPGTFTYLSDPAWRERFRGTTAHNTVTVEGVEQAAPAGPFRWSRVPGVRVLDWQSGPAEDTLYAVCEYGSIRHYRLVRLEKQEPRIWIADWVEGASTGIRQYWHLGEAADEIDPKCFVLAGARLAVEKSAKTTIEEGWRSHVLGSREPASVLRVDWEGTARRITVIDWQPEGGPLCLTAEWNDGSVAIQAMGRTAAHAILKWKPDR